MRDDGTCGVEFRCEDDTDCGGNLPHCDVASGRCVCTDDTEDSCTENHPAFQCRTDGACGCLEDSICPSSTGGHCHVDTGTCGCLTDDDCNGEICHEGQCRCATEIGCGIVISPTNPGTTFECIAL